MFDNGVLIINGTGSIARNNPFANYEKYIKYLQINEGITNIDVAAFKDLSYLSMAKLPNTLRSIGANAFGVCYGLKSINLPEGLETIGAHAFSITNLENIVFPSTITEIGDFAFSNNGSIKTVVISGNFETISTYAFSSCEKLETVIISGSVKTIAGYAFADCDKLKTIIIGNGVTTISDHAFDSNGVRNMAVPDSVIYIGDENIDYRTTVYCNDNSKAVEFVNRYYAEMDTIVGYDNFVKNYNVD